MKFKSRIRWNFIYVIIGYFLITSTISIYVFTIRLADEVDKQIEGKAYNIQQMFSSATEILNSFEHLQRMVSMINALPEVDSVYLLNINSEKIVAASEIALIGKTILEVPLPSKELLGSDDKHLHISSGYLENHEFWSATNMVLRASGELSYQPYRLIMRLNEGEVFAERLSFLLPSFLFQFLLLGVLSLTILWMIRKQIEEPVNYITAVLNDRKKGDSKVRVQMNLGVEFNQIAKSLNGSFDAIDSANKIIQEQQLQFAQAAKMSALGEMSSGIAHEINNPLAIISAQAAVMRKRLEKNEFESAKLLEQVGLIERTSLRISKIIKGLQTFSRSSQKDQMANCNLQEIISDTLILGVERIRSRGVQLTTEEVPNLSIFCQNVQISQVLLNLLNNAFDAVEKSEGPWIKILFEVNEGNVVIRIQDSGTGIPSEIVHRMMDPFFTTKDVGRGTGLGLSISKGIVESHGGQLKYRLLDGHTCFEILLPLNKS